VKLQYEAGEELVSMFVSQPDFDEYQLLREASDFLARELGVRVEVMKAGQQGIHDPGKRAKDALPLKPAFYLESPQSTTLKEADPPEEAFVQLHPLGGIPGNHVHPPRRHG